jgi:amino acid adenylation domain-containing protein
MVEPSLEMILGILGILKAGGAYLPIDPGYPEKRIRYMLADSKVNILVKNSNIISNLEKEQELFVLNFEHMNFEFVSNFDIRISDLNASNLAYIIYTSGSTGRPKGVLVQHGNVTRLVKNPNYIHWTKRQRLLLTGNLVFDITTFEIWGPLLNGLTLVLAAQPVILDAEKLGAVIAKEHISILHLIPQVFNQLLHQRIETFASLKCFLIGGDLVQPHYVNRLRNKYPHLQILHMYGPTENTTFSTFHPVEKGYPTTIPIGKPISNSTVYILDRYGNLQPVNVVGELYIGGDGTARGYLNNPGLTSEKFERAVISHSSLVISSSNKFSKATNYLLYRTGDLARWLARGIIEFMGRIDFQVKVRGMRVELGEIENRLKKHDKVKEAVLAVKGKEKLICSYIVPNQAAGEEITSELKEYLSHWLPDYMIPAYFIEIKQIPLTPNGKIDQKALPEPGTKIESDYIPPGDEVEKKLAVIWQEVLEKEVIGINDNFFQLGGHSLKAAAVAVKIKKEFNVDIPLVELFRAPFIKSLAQYVKAGKTVREAKDDKLVLLKPGPDKSNHLFFLHDGTGEVDGYIEFCSHLTHPMNYWGVRAQRLEGLAPHDRTIEETAAHYIETLKSLQPDGPYHIVGWSLGGTIAFEMALQLEQQQEKIGILVLIDALPPGPGRVEKGIPFNCKTELDFIRRCLPGEALHQRLKNINEIKGIWAETVNYLEENGPALEDKIETIKRSIPGLTAIPNNAPLSIRKLVQYLNIGRTLDNARSKYIPGRKPETVVHFFKAAGTKVIDPGKWNDYCQKPVRLYELGGDHHSLLKMPQVETTAKLFEKIQRENKQK